MLTVTATAKDNGGTGSACTTTYQWYSNTSESNTGGTMINGATLASYITPATQSIGNYYYYCVVSVQKGEVRLTTTSAAVTVGVEKLNSSDLAAEDFNVTFNPADLTYTGEAKTATAEAKINGLGAVNVKYKAIPGGIEVVSPTDVGSYELVINVAASTNNETVTIDGAGIMTIDRATQPQPADVMAENATSGNDGKITNVNSNMEYRGIGEAAYKEITGTEVTGLAPGIYYVRLKGNANHLPGADLSIAVAQGAIPVYTVIFISEGATKFAEQSIEKDAKAVRPATEPKKTNFTFTGWMKVKDGVDAFDFTHPITTNTTVYAGWVANPTYSVKGKVTDGESVPNPLKDVSVEIYPLGIVAKTDADGIFTLTDVPAGSYNLIATDAAGNSVTLFITVTGEMEIDQQITINGKASSKLVVKTGAPELVVNKLDELAVSEQSNSDNILIKLVASPLTEETATGATQIESAMTNDGMQMSAILDLSLFKTVNDGAPQKMEELTGKMIEVIIPIPDSIRENKDFTLYRYHFKGGGAVHKITTSSNADGEKIVIAADRSYMTAMLNKFSSYALATMPTYTVCYMLDVLTVFATQTVTDQGLAMKPSPEPVKSGYILEAWCKDANGTQPWNFASDKVTGNLLLYPKWKVKPEPTPDPTPDPNPDPNPDYPVGVEDVSKDEVRIYGTTGAVVIEGVATGTYRVVSLVGPAFAAGFLKDDRTEIALPVGVYVVTLQGKSRKVVVK